MSLINKILTELEDPKNHKLLTNSQDRGFYHEYKYDNYDIEMFHYFEFSDNEYYDFEELPEERKLFFLRHCINLLPCFDDINPEYNVNVQKMEYGQDKEYYKGVLSQIPYSIRQALLTCGAMNTEELETYYKSLIK